MKWASLMALLAGCSNAPLRFHLQAPANDDCVIHYRMSGGGQSYDLKMKLHYRVLSANEVEIGPGTFPENPNGPKWPAGATARFHFSENGHDDNWTLSAPPELPADEVARWKSAMEQRYAFAVGIVEFPEKAGQAKWERTEHQPEFGTVHRYRVLSRQGERATVRVDEESTLDGQKAAVERITGEVTYDLRRPLPIGGWLEIESQESNGSPVKVRYEYGN
jgi:hypothetical protein